MHRIPEILHHSILESKNVNEKKKKNEPGHACMAMNLRPLHKNTVAQLSAITAVVTNLMIYFTQNWGSKIPWNNAFWPGLTNTFWPTAVV